MTWILLKTISAGTHTRGAVSSESPARGKRKTIEARTAVLPFEVPEKHCFGLGAYFVLKALGAELSLDDIKMLQVHHNQLRDLNLDRFFPEAFKEMHRFNETHSKASESLSNLQEKMTLPCLVFVCFPQSQRAHCFSLIPSAQGGVEVYQDKTTSNPARCLVFNDLNAAVSALDGYGSVSIPGEPKVWKVVTLY